MLMYLAKIRMLQNSQPLKVETGNDISKVKTTVFLDLKLSHLCVHMCMITHTHTTLTMNTSKDSTLFTVIITTPNIIILNIY